MAKVIERQIRWEVESSDGPLVHHYKLLIINEPRDIAIIKQRLQEEMQPADRPYLLDGSKIRGTPLSFELFAMDSYGKPPNKIDWAKIYKGRINRDSNLVRRKTIDGLLSYVDHGIAHGRF